jgi:hypothetical protein
MATLPKVLISRADYHIGGGVALGLRTQGTSLSGNSSPQVKAYREAADKLRQRW